MVKAKFLRRFWAWLADGIAVWIVSAAIGAAVTFFVNASATSSDFMSFLTAWVALFLIIVIFLLQFLYFGLLWSRPGGQTLGMKIFNMRLVRRSGGPVGFLRAGLRGTVGYWISSFLFFLGYIWAAFDSEKEAWHDKIFDTWVVETKE
ncbi:MAG: RDD family protein [Candidatus Promineifilaceae bacterium]|nr:RDD family protein [Candidatus Promineifilaceae bacterium]